MSGGAEMIGELQRSALTATFTQDDVIVTPSIRMYE